MSNIVYIGDMTGEETPMTTTWGDPPVELLIASGGKLQGWSGGELRTIEDSPECNIVTKAGGRVIVASTLGDRITLSGVGDCDDWTTDGEDWTSLNAIWIDIGYKSGGNITAITSLNKDLMVFKEDGICYRIVGWYPDWQVVEVGRSITNISRFTVVQESNDVFFLDRHYGIHSIGSVAEYGEMKISKFGKQINFKLAGELGDDARLWSVPSRNELWVKPDRDYKWVYVLSLVTGGWTVFSFPLEPLSVTSSKGVTYLTFKGAEDVRPNGGFYSMVRYSGLDMGVSPVESKMSLRPLVGGGKVLMKRGVLDMDGDAAIRMEVNGLGMVQGVIDGSTRFDTRQIVNADELRMTLFSTDGRARVRQISVDIVHL